MATPFNQGAPSVPVVLSSSNVFVFGNTASGTALSVQQFGAGNVASFSNAAGNLGLFVSSLGRVGVGGLTAPATPLHVSGQDAILAGTGTGSYSSNVLQLYTGATGTGYYQYSANLQGFNDTVGSVTWKFNTVNNGVSYPNNLVMKNGNVGIGTASPLVPLHLYSSGGASLYIEGTGIGGTTGMIEFRKAGNQVADIVVTNTAAAWSTDAYVNDLVIRTQSSNVLFNVNGGGGASAVKIAANGNVGIGAVPPLQTLHVYSGNSGNPTGGAGAGADSNATVRIQMVTVGLDIGTTTAGGCTWFQNRQPGTSLSTTLPIALNPLGGNVGIGTANPQTQLDVFGNVRSYNMTQINKNTGVGNGVALGNLLFTVSWDTAQGDGQNPIIIEVTQTVGLSGGGYYTRVAHVFICSFNDNSTNPSIFSSAQISTSSLSITATPTVSTGGRAGTTSVTVTTTPGYASTASNKSYSIHARVICVPPSVGNIYFA